MKLSQAYETFILYKRASGVSENTISNYQKTWQKVRLYFHADPEFHTITLEDWLRFMAWVPDEFSLAPKSVANIHTDLSSLYTWATDMDVVGAHLFRRIPRPRFEKPAIIRPRPSKSISHPLKSILPRKPHPVVTTKNGVFRYLRILDIDENGQKRHFTLYLVSILSIIQLYSRYIYTLNVFCSLESTTACFT